MPNTLDTLDCHTELVRSLPLRRLPSRWRRSLLPFLFLCAFFVFRAAPAHAQITLTAFAQDQNFSQDQTVFQPSKTTTIHAIVLNASGWAVNWMKINIDGTTYNAVLGGPGGQYEGSVTWDTTQVPNPSEHSISATAEIQFQQEGGGGQTLELSSTAQPPPQNWLPNAGYGDGRAADLIVANMQLQSLQFGGQNNLTLEQDATTPVPVPQITWTQGTPLSPATTNPAGYVMSSTPTMTLTLFPLTGSVTQGYTMTAAATPNTGDPAVTFKDTGSTPVPFSGSSFTVTSDNPLLSKVAAYTLNFNALALWVQFTRTGLSPPPWGEVSVNAYNDGIQSSSFSNTLYATLTQPTAPMANPWVGVLNYACTWAKGDTTAIQTTTDLVTNFHASGYYNPMGYTFIENGFPDTFHLQQFLNSELGKNAPDGYYAGCNAFADFLVCISNSLGAVHLYPQIGNSAPTTFTTNPVSFAPAITVSGAKSTSMSYHEWGTDGTSATANADIYDAALLFDKSGVAVYATGTNGPLSGSSYYTLLVQSPPAPPADWNTGLGLPETVKIAN